MDFESVYIAHKEKGNLIKLEIKNKKKLFQDLNNIENSWTGRADANICNIFIQESAQLIVNSIVLFEKGYFDCAYYSLRQSLEISTTMVFLMELDDNKRKEELTKWKNKSKFPMYGEMVRYLIQKGKTFSEIKEKMSKYFQGLEQAKRQLNKYIHKQGFDTFYVSRSHVLNENRDDSLFIKEFNDFIKICIGAVAVLRLTIDPFPILLMDEEIYKRSLNNITEAYTKDFVDIYIGKSNIKAYKQTELYKGYYDAIMLEEKKSSAVVELKNFQFIDRKKVDEYFKQIHFFCKRDIRAVKIMITSNKIAKIYCYNGLLFYFTTTETNRLKHSYNSSYAKEVQQETGESWNFPYEEAFLSRMNIYGEVFVIEHNSKFGELEIKKLRSLFK